MIRAALAVLVAAFLIACADKPQGGAQPPAASPPSVAQPSQRPAGNASTAPRADLQPELPRADPFDLARRYRGLDLPPQSMTQPAPAGVGDSRTFIVYDLAATRANEVRASLLA